MTIQSVTAETLDELVERYTKARGSVENEDTDSEAMFVFSARFDGAYILSTGRGIYWIGVQNATGRMTERGKGLPYSTIRHAIEDALAKNSRAVFYTDDAIERQRWFADRIEQFKAMGGIRVALSHCSNSG